MKKIKGLLLISILLITLTSCGNTEKTPPEPEASSYSQELFNARNPYIGDSTADIEILQLLKVKEDLGDYAIELQTEKEPYSMRIDFETPVDERDEFDMKMQSNAFLLLSLIENSGEVQWSYPSSQGEEEDLITVYVTREDAREILEKELSEYCNSPSDLEELIKESESICSNNKYVYKESICVPCKEAVISPDQNIGADMVQLHYASDDTIIFHGYFGLFIYSLKDSKILDSIDLKSIDCSDTQGDNYCEVTVNSEGTLVLIHNISKKYMYIYSTLDKSLTRKNYESLENPFKLVPTEKEVEFNTHNHSYESVQFENGDTGYLSCDDYTLGTLHYIRNQKKQYIFNK